MIKVTPKSVGAQHFHAHPSAAASPKASKKLGWTSRATEFNSLMDQNLLKNVPIFETRGDCIYNSEFLKKVKMGKMPTFLPSFALRSKATDTPIMPSWYICARYSAYLNIFFFHVKWRKNTYQYALMKLKKPTLNRKREWNFKFLRGYLNSVQLF